MLLSALVLGWLTGLHALPQATASRTRAHNELQCIGKPGPDNRYGTVYECHDENGVKFWSEWSPIQELPDSYLAADDPRRTHSWRTVTIRTYDAKNHLESLTHFTNRKQDGPQELFFEDGSRKYVETYKDDVKDGVCERYSSPGKLASRKIYKNGDLVLDGYYQEGAPDYIWRLSNGKEDGLYESFYHSSGKPKEKVPYSKGQRDGIGESFFETGQVMKHENFVQGKKHGLEQNFYANGKLESERCWQDDRVVEDLSPCKPGSNGDRKEYFETGQLRFLAQAKNGKLDGRYEQYAQDGTQLLKGQYADGERVGEWISKNEKGVLESKVTYKTPSDYVSQTFFEKGTLESVVHSRDRHVVEQTDYYQNGKPRIELKLQADGRMLKREYDGEGLLVAAGTYIPAGTMDQFYDVRDGKWFEIDRDEDASQSTKTEFEYKLGALDGVLRVSRLSDGEILDERVFENDVLKSRKIFAKGKPQSEVTYFPDGSVQSKRPLTGFASK